MDRQLKAMVKPASSKLLAYSTPDDFGKWNCNVFDDIQNDSQFRRLSDALHSEALRTQFSDLPVSDGIDIIGVDIELRTLLTVRFKLCFLSPTYFFAPADFTLKLDSDNSTRGIVEYRFGIKDRNGKFRLNSKNCVFPGYPSEWVTSISYNFGGDPAKLKTHRGRR